MSCFFQDIYPFFHLPLTAEENWFIQSAETDGSWPKQMVRYWWSKSGISITASIQIKLFWLLWEVAFDIAVEQNSSAVSLHPTARCVATIEAFLWSCISDSRDRRTAVEGLQTGAEACGPVGAFVRVHARWCMCRSTADIRNLLLPWHCPSNCHAGLASVYRSYPLLLPLRSLSFFSSHEGRTHFRVVVVWVSLSSRRLFLSFFISML